MSEINKETEISVKRLSDGKVFTNNMSSDESIYEIHFCTSYTQVRVQEVLDGKLTSQDVFCRPLGTEMSPIDSISFRGDEEWGILELRCSEKMK